MNYINTIKIALLVFPLIALLFTIPFILHQYHKYGSINKLRVFIVYSFILYMITIYFLVILPLPAIDEVIKKPVNYNLTPFNFIKDFIKESSFVLNDPSTYLKALTESSFYTVIFNIFMTMPFGMYLRYYFKCSFKKTVFFSFLLSLFFEVTQLTGLYFIYPYPYRLFDVDDLIMNTLGGMLGFYIMGLFTRFLPTREEIDKSSLTAGTKVSGLRRLTSFFLDLVLYLILTIPISFFFHNEYILQITFLIYYIIYPYLSNGQTPAHKFLNIKVEYEDHAWIRLPLRTIFIYLYYFQAPFFALYLYPYLTQNIIGEQFKILLFIFYIIGIFLFYFINTIVILKGNGIFYDSLWKAHFKSTIRVEE